MPAARPYHEPSIVSILSLSSFLLISNVSNFLLDRAICCGLLGQILIGVAWGTPGGKLLGPDIEAASVQFGYIGLILLVYEGGVSTSFSAVKANFFLSIAVAITGVCLPIALSFSLLRFANVTPLSAFAAGAALCSTSLGTTFTVLSTSGLTQTRLGAVLTTAAMLDDVVGLIMVQVISELGSSTSSFHAVTIVRPIAVSVGMVVALLLACRFLVLPLASWLGTASNPFSENILRQASLHPKQTAFVIHSLLLVGMAVSATYAGTSNLFAAYLAGASISWWDSEWEDFTPGEGESELGCNDIVCDDDKTGNMPPTAANGNNDPAHKVNTPHLIPPEVTSSNQTTGDLDASSHEIPAASQFGGVDISGSAIYEHYYSQVVQKVLKPFFFASIGFSIPVTQMFHGHIVWRGLIYTTLMLLGKLLTGLWLVRIASPSSIFASILKPLTRLPLTCWSSPQKPTTTGDASATKVGEINQSSASNAGARTENVNQPKSKSLPKPLSLYPASILGSAMVARGEIGFLIASVAESKGVFGASPEGSHVAESKDSDTFLIAIWAITLCTVLGPLTVGFLVRRVRKLQQNQQGSNPSTRDPLGIWGVR